MVISVFPNLNNNGVSELAFDVIKILTDGGADVYVQNEYKPIFKSTKAKFENFDKAMSLCDCAIAIGGDGTTLNIAKKAAFLNKSALGINAGRLGFMSGIERDELSLLTKLINKEYIIDERAMLKATIEKTVKYYHHITALMI